MDEYQTTFEDNECLTRLRNAGFALVAIPPRYLKGVEPYIIEREMWFTAMSEVEHHTKESANENK